MLSVPRAAIVACLVLASMTAAVGQSQDPEELVKQGRALFSQGKHEDAERLYRQAIHVSPRSFQAARALGILLTLRGQYPEARTHLQRAVTRLELEVQVRPAALQVKGLPRRTDGDPECLELRQVVGV